MIRLGMLSFAHMHAHSYAASINALAGCELVAVYDDDPERGQQAAEQYETRFASSLEHFFSHALDGVIICSENVNHRQHVEAAAGEVGYILCEKPIATNLEDASAMLDVCAQTQTHLQLAFPVRFSPPIERLAQVVRSGGLGELYAATCTNHGKMPSGWFRDVQLAGGGAVMDHTVHVVDALRWMTGAEVVEVYATIQQQLMHPDTALDVAIDDIAINDMAIDDAGLLSLVMAGGLLTRPLQVSLDASWSRPDSYPTWGDVTIEMVGKQGTLWVDAFKQHATLYRNSNPPQQAYWGSDLDRRLIVDFCEAIVQQRPPSITGEDGVKALEVALAAYRSALEHSLIFL